MGEGSVGAYLVAEHVPAEGLDALAGLARDALPRETKLVRRGLDAAGVAFEAVVEEAARHRVPQPLALADAHGRRRIGPQSERQGDTKITHQALKAKRNGTGTKALPSEGDRAQMPPNIVEPSFLASPGMVVASRRVELEYPRRVMAGTQLFFANFWSL